VFYEWIERKLKYGEIQKQTYDRYVIDFERFIGVNEISNRKIKNIEENELEDFIMDTIVKNKLTSKSWGNLRIIIRALFLYSKKRRYSKLNISLFFSELEISNKVFAKSKRQDELNVFTEEELKKITEKLWEKNKIGHLGVLMAVYTGMRVGEIASLKWEDVKDNYIHINRCQIKYKDENGKTIHEIRNSPKTEAGIRDIVIIPEVKKVLKKVRTINPFSEYVFEKNGEPMSIHSFGMILYRICEEVGVTKRGMHVLRKTYATRLINAGVEESIIINQMGHTDFKTTKNYYYYNNKANGYMSEMIQSALAL
jgi:integrase